MMFLSICTRSSVICLLGHSGDIIHINISTSVENVACAPSTVGVEPTNAACALALC